MHCSTTIINTFLSYFYGIDFSLGFNIMTICYRVSRWCEAVRFLEYLIKYKHFHPHSSDVTVSPTLNYIWVTAHFEGWVWLFCLKKNKIKKSKLPKHVLTPSSSAPWRKLIPIWSKRKKIRVVTPRNCSFFPRDFFSFMLAKSYYTPPRGWRINLRSLNRNANFIFYPWKKKKNVLGQEGKIYIHI